MFRNYLIVAYRNFMRHKVYSVINVVGLSIGIAFCILTFLYVRHEWSFDAFHDKADRIYRVYTKGEVGEGSVAMATMPGPLGPALAEAFPEQMQRVVRIHTRTRTLRYEERSLRVRIAYVDPGFRDVFTFPMLKGDPETALDGKDAIVITEKTARKFFGREDPIGKSISLTRDSEVRKALITGTLKDIPATSSIQFDCLQSFENVEDALDAWNMVNNTSVYVLLNEHVDVAALEGLFPRFVKWSWPIMGEKQEMKLQPLSDVRFSPKIRAPEPATDRAYSYILLCVAVLILFIACVNFTSLALARSPSRAQEVGIRKVAGARRLQVIAQFLSESILLGLVPLAVGLVLAEVLMPLFNSLMAQELSLAENLDGSAVAALIGMAMIVGLFAGSYPAFILSGFVPIYVLNDRLRIVGAGVLSRFLLVFQIAMSAALVICALVVTSQLHYLRTKPLGFDREHVIAVGQLGKLRDLENKGIETYRDALLSHHAIIGVTGMFHLMDNRQQSRGGVVYDGTDIKGVEIFFVDYDFVPTLDIELIEGRNYSRDLGKDVTASVIINETLARQLGPGSPIGKTLRFFDEITVIGVVNDFHFRSLHHKIGPALLKCEPDYPYDRLVVRVRPDDIPGTLAYMRDRWEAVTKSSGFHHFFLDESIDRQYRTEERLHRIVGYGTLLAVFVACLGAFGLTAFAVTRRTKEIGIRKISGASVTDVVGLLFREFVLLVGAANAIAWPVAWWAMDRWLQDFAYRIEPGIGTFILGGILTLAVVLLTVSVQAVPAARANPVDALRYE